MKRCIVTLILATVLFTGCNQPTQTLNSCQTARQGLTVSVLAFNYIYSQDPKHYSASDLAAIQNGVNTISACIDGLCLDPNNPTFQPCIDAGMKALNIKIYATPIQTPIVVPVAGAK